MKKTDEIDILKRNVKDLQGQLTDAYKKIRRNGKNEQRITKI